MKKLRKPEAAKPAKMTEKESQMWWGTVERLMSMGWLPEAATNAATNVVVEEFRKAGGK